MTVGKGHALLGAETGSGVGQGPEIAAVKGVHDQGGFARKIQVAALDAPVAVGRVAPVVHLRLGANEEFRKDHGIVAA